MTGFPRQPRLSRTPNYAEIARRYLGADQAEAPTSEDPGPTTEPNGCPVPATVAEVSARLAPGGPGWVVLTLAALDHERVVVVRELPPPRPIPAEVAGLPKYTLPELEKLALAGPVAGPALLRALHELHRLVPSAGWKVARVEPRVVVGEGGA